MYIDIFINIFKNTHTHIYICKENRGLDFFRCIFVLKSHLDWRPPHQTQFLAVSCDLTHYCCLPAHQPAFSIQLERPDVN